MSGVVKLLGEMKPSSYAVVFQAATSALFSNPLRGVKPGYSTPLMIRLLMCECAAVRGRALPRRAQREGEDIMGGLGEQIAWGLRLRDLLVVVSEVLGIGSG